MKISRNQVLGLLLMIGVAGVAGYTVLINPDNPLTRLFQRKITAVDTRIVIGPYPVERDFRLLHASKVTLIVSLLDPALPYESTLLAKERKLAAARGMRVENFPMSSILGQKFGGYYADSAARAAALIASTNDKVYLHCYLGLHRIQVVRDLLTARGLPSGVYTVRRAEREVPRLQLDAAESAYQHKRYEEALAALAQIPAAQLTSSAHLLQGWCNYQLGQPEAAAAFFTGLLVVVPAEANVGLGYCALRTGDTAGATRYFETAVQLAPANAEDLGGLGLAYYRAGRLPEAARELEEALKLTPDNTELREVLARINPPPAR